MEDGSKKFYLPALDGLRFFAFLLVFVHHHPLLIGTPLGFFNAEGWIGVDLFFALSAFLFTELLTREFEWTGRIDYRKFYMRRIFRIWPAYFFFVLLCLALHLATHRVDARTGWIRFAGLFSFTDNLFMTRYGYDPIPFTQHLWSIGFEEQYYLLIPPFLWFFGNLHPRARRITISVIVLGLFGYKIFLASTKANALGFWSRPWEHFESIGLGVLLAWSVRKGLWKSLNAAIPFIVGSSCFAVQCFLPSIDESSLWLVPKYLLAAVASVCWILTALNGVRLRQFLSHPILVHLGRRSYGLYLYHFAAIGSVDFLLHRLFGHQERPFPSFCLGLAATWLAAYASYRWLEAPFLRLKHRFEVVASRPV